MFLICKAEHTYLYILIKVFLDTGNKGLIVPIPS